jgi:hexosaminidase
MPAMPPPVSRSSKTATTDGWSRPAVFESGGGGLVSTADDFLAFATRGEAGQFTGTLFTVAAPALVPQPVRMTVHDGQFSPSADSPPLRGPEPVVSLAREVLGEQATGITFVDSADGPAEGYRLRVDPEGVLVEGDPAGLGWAIQTLRQLGDPRFALPCVEIEDAPHYAYRGSLLDVARWYQPIDFLYRYVDGLALHKLNVLHLHLTDDQGWRFEVTGYPGLTEVGGFRDESSAGHAREGRFDGTPHGGWYTQQELRDLVAYARRRGVSVLPEIDIPGHMQAAIAAYPELGNGARVGVRTSWGISRHVLNPQPSTVDFVRSVLDELVDVFPFGYVHLGGDEVPPDEWRASEAAGQRATALGLSTVDELVGWWNRELTAHLATYGRRGAAWDEVLEQRPADGTLVFAWRNRSRVEAALEAGYDVIACPQETAYFDWAESDDDAEPLAIRGTTPLETVYGYRPGPVRGVQGQLWTEYLPTPDLIGYRAYPRMCALAEVAWTSPEPRDVAEFRARLATHLPRLTALGLNHR